MIAGICLIAISIMLTALAIHERKGSPKASLCHAWLAGFNACMGLVLIIDALV